MENERVQMCDVLADTKSAVAKGAAERDLRGVWQGATARGAAKVRQLCHALSWQYIVAQQSASEGGCRRRSAVLRFDTPALV